MRLLLPLALLLLSVASVASAALPAEPVCVDAPVADVCVDVDEQGEVFASCASGAATTAVACESSDDCSSTYVLDGAVRGFTCVYSFHRTTCIQDRQQLVSWCRYESDYTESTSIHVQGVAYWAEGTHEPCYMRPANAVDVACPAGAPPSPASLPVTWGHVLP